MEIDSKLIEACLSNKRESQKQLYTLLLPYLRAITKRYIRNQCFVKDVLQESFIKIFNKLETYDHNKATLKTWAAKIAINESLNYNKRKIGAPKEEIGEEAHTIFVYPKIVAELSNQDLLSILKQMPTGYFEVFNLSVIDGYKHEEIAEMLNISTASSRKKLSRSKDWLKKKFPNLHEGYKEELLLPKN